MVNLFEEERGALAGERGRRRLRPSGGLGEFDLVFSNSVIEHVGGHWRHSASPSRSAAPRRGTGCRRQPLLPGSSRTSLFPVPAAHAQARPGRCGRALAGGELRRPARPRGSQLDDALDVELIFVAEMRRSPRTPRSSPSASPTSPRADSDPPRLTPSATPTRDPIEDTCSIEYEARAPYAAPLGKTAAHRPDKEVLHVPSASPAARAQYACRHLTLRARRQPASPPPRRWPRPAIRTSPSAARRGRLRLPRRPLDHR